MRCLILTTRRHRRGLRSQRTSSQSQGLVQRRVDAHAKLWRACSPALPGPPVLAVEYCEGSSSFSWWLIDRGSEHLARIQDREGVPLPIQLVGSGEAPTRLSG